MLLVFFGHRGGAGQEKGAVAVLAFWCVRGRTKEQGGQPLFFFLPGEKAAVSPLGFFCQGCRQGRESSDAATFIVASMNVTTHRLTIEMTIDQ